MTAERPRPNESVDEEYEKILKTYRIHETDTDVRDYTHDRHVIRLALQGANYDASSALAEFLVTYIQEQRQIEFIVPLTQKSEPNKEYIKHEREKMMLTRERRKEIGVEIFGEEADDIAAQTKSLFLRQRPGSAARAKKNREKGEDRTKFIREIGERFPQSKLPFRPL